MKKEYGYKIVNPEMMNYNQRQRLLAEQRFVELLESNGYKLVSEYKSKRVKVDIQCPEGHVYNALTVSFQKGDRCPICKPEKIRLKRKVMYEDLLSDEGYKLISEYKTARDYSIVICPEGHEWRVKLNDFQQGVRCPHCDGSTGQRELQRRLQEKISSKVIYNDRDTLGGLELDIYYPELNVAIEYQGNYWHSLKEQKRRDRIKRWLCKKKDIKLMEVWDLEFLANPDTVEIQVYDFIKQNVCNADLGGV